MIKFRIAVTPGSGEKNMIKEAHWISEDTGLAAFDKTPNSDITKI